MALLALTSLSGCGWSFVADRKSNPVIKDYIGGTTREDEAVGVLGTTASHRTVIVRLNTENGVGQRGEFCPEPPPDVSQAIADSFAAALQAEVDTPASQTSGSGSLAVASTFSSSVAPLIRRSQGLQFYRDGMYYLCVAYINHVISQAEYNAQSGLLQKDARELIELDAKNPAPFINITVQSADPGKSAEDILKKLEDILSKVESSQSDQDTEPEKE
jgi:hypothetical protein